jgi:signal transduction histidine kinase
MGFCCLKLLGFEGMEVCTTENISAVSSPRSAAKSQKPETAAGACPQTAPGKQSVSAQDCTSIDTSPKTNVKLRLLLVEGDPADVELGLLALRKDGFDISSDVVQTAEEFRLRIQATAYDLILADYNLPQWSGMEALALLRRENLDVPLIVVTGNLGEEKAVECVKRGATDCVLKDHLARLPTSVRRALEEKRLRKQRRQSEQELARSNAELEQFAYVASHDLQEPLRMIANYTQLLAERYRGRLDEQADKYIAYAVDGATRMQALIQDLLKFSRLGKGQIETRTTDCRAVVEQAVKNLQAAILESGAAVNWNGLPVVRGDAGQLTQVFQNLIANAIKFHGADTPVVQIDAEQKDHDWVLSVSDNGIGIPSENWQDVFVIFRRLHTRTEYAGNGVGLSICKKIIERHGGKIWIEAQAKPGCHFKFTLPSEPSSRTTQGAQA